jgi:DNA-binding beta-propeller fold protein YncE
MALRLPLRPLARPLLILALALAALPLYRAVQAFSDGQPASLVLGNSSFTSDGLRTARTLHNPSAVAIDPASGKLFVADSNNNRVLRFASAAALSNGAPAEGVLGQADFISDKPAAGERGLSYPSALALDSTGRLWVADLYNNRVLRFDSAASRPNGAPADAVLGQPDFGSHLSSTTREQIGQPQGLALDSAGRLWVADGWGQRVLRFDSAASKPNGAPADAVLGQPDFTSGAFSEPTATTLAGPHALALDSAGRLWVADSYNSRVLRFDSAASKPNGAPADAVLGQTSFTSKAGALTRQGLGRPLGLSVDGAGRLWVADTDNSRVLRFDSAASKPNGAPADAVLGQPDFTTHTTATPTQQSTGYPRGLLADGAGRLWVAESDRVLRFDSATSKPDGAPANGVLGEPDFTSLWFTFRNTLYLPGDVAVDPASGKVYVADYDNNRVLRFASAAALASGADAEAVLGQPDFTSKARATSRQGMRRPSGLALDSAGRLWVADSGNHRVLRFDGAASKSSSAPADAVLGQPGFTSAITGTTQAAMQTPIGVEVDSAGRLWVADTSNNRVLRFDGAASKPNGAPADAVLGQQSLNKPSGVAVGSDGRLWVADTGNNRVLRFDSAASKPSGAPADAVLGQPDFSGWREDTTRQTMRAPSDVELEGGRLWVADFYNYRVLRFDAAASKPNGAPADGVLGQPDFTSKLMATTRQGLAHTHGIAVDSSGQVWVADTVNNRVLMFEPQGPPVLEPRVYLPSVARGS